MNSKHETLGVASLALGFFADVLYLKGVINDLEAEAIYNISSPEELNIILDSMLKEEYKNEGRYIRN